LHDAICFAVEELFLSPGRYRYLRVTGIGWEIFLFLEVGAITSGKQMKREHSQNPNFGKSRRFRLSPPKKQMKEKLLIKLVESRKKTVSAKGPSN